MEGSGSFSSVDIGVHGELCGSLSGMALAEHYVAKFKDLGGEVLLKKNVTRILLEGEEHRYAPWKNISISGIQTESGDIYRASNFLMATGAWTHDLLSPVGISSGVLPKKRQLFGIKISDPGQILKDFTTSLNTNSLSISLSKTPAIILPSGGVYIKSILDRNFIMVGSADDLGQPYSMEDPQPDRQYYQEAIRPVLEHYFPTLTELEPKTLWAGYYAYYWPDKNPVLESVKNLSWISGTSGSGIMKADALGRIAAAKLNGKDQAELADGSMFPVESLSLRNRNVKNEAFII